MSCEQILVLDQGRIVERGNHAQLLLLQGKYASLWNSQETIRIFVSAFLYLLFNPKRKIHSFYFNFPLPSLRRILFRLLWGGGLLSGHWHRKLRKLHLSREFGLDQSRYGGRGGTSRLHPSRGNGGGVELVVCIVVNSLIDIILSSNSQNLVQYHLCNILFNCLPYRFIFILNIICMNYIV